MPDAARLGDNHICPQTSPAAHRGGRIEAPCADNVKVGGAKSARAQDKATCEGTSEKDWVLLGAPAVYLGGGMAARVDDPTGHRGKVSAGFEKVKIGGPTAKITMLPDGQMEVAWGGIVIRGEPADVATFTKMLNEDLTVTHAGKRTLAKVVNDRSRPAFLCSVGRNQDKIYVDGINAPLPVDLNDLEQLPRMPSTAHPNEITRGELIGHFLSERDEYARQGYTTFTRSDFDHVHAHGQIDQNHIRRELGQSPIREQTYIDRADGSTNTVFWYEDGTSTTIDIGANGVVTNMVKP